MIGHKYTPTVGHTGSYAFGDHVRRNHGATVVELGPGAGIEGGKVIYAGPFEQYSHSNSWKHLLLQANTVLPSINIDNNKILTLSIVKFKSLSNLEAHLPLGCLINVFGKSSSGKTTFLDVLFRVLESVGKL